MASPVGSDPISRFDGVSVRTQVGNFEIVGEEGAPAVGDDDFTCEGVEVTVNLSDVARDAEGVFRKILRACSGERLSSAQFAAMILEPGFFNVAQVGGVSKPVLSVPLACEERVKSAALAIIPATASESQARSMRQKLFTQIRENIGQQLFVQTQSLVSLINKAIVHRYPSIDN